MKPSRDQIIVFSSEIGAMTAAALTLWLAYTTTATTTLTTPAARLAWGVQWLIFPVLTLCIGMALVMLQRITTAAIDPLAGVDNDLPKLKLYKQYLQNTLEQLVLYALVHLAFCTIASPRLVALEPWFAGIFVAGRALFLVGYMFKPVWRSPGFGLTYYPTLLLALYVAYAVIAH